MEPFNLRLWKNFPSNLPDMVIDQIVIDSRRISSKNALFVAFNGFSFDGHLFLKQAYAQGARVALVKHDFCDDTLPQDFTLIKVFDTLRALQEIAASYRNELSTQIIAITGSHGKTMLKDLLYTLCKDTYPTFHSPESFNSQLGVALSILKISEKDKIAIIEVGVSEEGDMDTLVAMLGKHSTIITNIGSAHLSSFKAKENIAKEKAKIFTFFGWTLIPDDELLSPYIAQNQNIAQNQKVFYWNKASLDLPEVTRDVSHSSSYEITFPSSKKHTGTISEEFSYSTDLLQMAVKAAYLLKIPEENIIKALEHYIPEPMRIELVKTSNNATIINDTYVADPMSCDIALKQYPTNLEKGAKKIFFFEGLRDEENASEKDLERVAHAIAKHDVDLCILKKTVHSELLVQAIQTFSPRTQILVGDDEKSALHLVKEHLHPGDFIIIKSKRKRSISSLICEFEESLPNNQVIINLATLQSNIERIRATVGNSKRIMVMVKALAYGTDDILLSQFLSRAGVDILGVSYVDEGVVLRRAGILQDIFVINATEYEAKKAVKWDLEIGVSEPHIISALQKEAAELGKKIKVHLHVNTGMNRLGCRLENVASLATLISAQPNLIFQGIWSHFAASDSVDEDAFTQKQIAVFDKAIAAVHSLGLRPTYQHISNSGAALRFSTFPYNMVRLGIAVYGLHNSSDTEGLIDIRPAISLVSRIVGINRCDEGDTISYGRLHTVTKPNTRIAVLPLGYYDGLHRNYSGKHYVLIRGKKAPMVGRICMDYMMCDISDIPDATIGDPALIFGEDSFGNYVSPQALALAGNSIVHELMTCLGPRIQRLFIYDEALRPR